MFEDAFMGRLFPRELREAKITEFLDLKQDSMSVQEYILKFTQLSRYAPESLFNMRRRMSLFVVRLSNLSNSQDNDSCATH